jgi:hypothetical protein
VLDSVIDIRQQITMIMFNDLGERLLGCVRIRPVCRHRSMCVCGGGYNITEQLRVLFCALWAALYCGKIIMPHIEYFLVTIT